MRTPNLNALRMFDAAARHLNFRLAAEELNLTQGAVAQQVRRIEADLELKLFHRQARGLTLTRTGRSYSTSIRRALAIIDKATMELQPQNTRLTLSVPPSFATKWLVPRLKGFRQAHPDIEVTTVASEELSNFTKDDVDMAIRLGDPPFGRDLNAQLLTPLNLCAVCSPEYASSSTAISTTAALADHKLIHDAHGHWGEFFAKHGLNMPRRIIKFNQTALAIDAARNDEGIALVPRLLVQSALEENSLVVLWENSSKDQNGYYIVNSKQHQTSHSHLAMINWLISEIKHIPKK